LEILERLLDEHGAALVLWAEQWCRTPEDVVQEAFLQLVRQTVIPENVTGWLYRVVRNGAISASRSAGTRRRHEVASACRGQLWFEPSDGQGLDAATAAEALGGLPIEQRESIVARLWGGLSFEQIGQLTGSSTSTAHRWYRAGLSALRERLGVSCAKRPSLRS